MSVEVNLVGVKCNLACPYCYEHPMRDAGNFTKAKDLDKIKERLEEIGGSFALFGGEALLSPKEDIEEMWKFGMEKFGYNGIQTNGVLIDDDHIEMIKKYNVHVGISLDGPGDLNESRWSGTQESTLKNTNKTLNNIDKLLANGITPSLIITLYQGNVRNGRFEIFKDWLIELDKKGIKHARIHLLEVDHPDVEKTMKLTDQENVDCMIDLYKLESEELSGLKFDVFKDLRNLLLGEDEAVTCVWNACDPQTTSAVQGVDANGDQHNCGRTNKDGVNWHKSSTPGHERQLALYHTPWENNGCKGCRFFIFCKGECPGTGENYDWRNKTDQCFVWYSLFEYVEQELIKEGHNPVSLRGNLKRLEHIMLGEWAKGNRINIKQAMSISSGNNVYLSKSNSNHGDHSDGGENSPHGDSHGDHLDSGENNFKNQEHGDSHGDEAHGDHTDQSLNK